MHTIITLCDDEWNSKSKRMNKKANWLIKREMSFDDEGRKINDYRDGFYLFGGVN